LGDVRIVAAAAQEDAVPMLACAAQCLFQRRVRGNGGHAPDMIARSCQIGDLRGLVESELVQQVLRLAWQRGGIHREPGISLGKQSCTGKGRQLGAFGRSMFASRHSEALRRMIMMEGASMVAGAGARTCASGIN
jgi:hypothetical protein